MTDKPILDDIPRADLIGMLKQQAWYSGNREGMPPHAYSFDVCEETYYRDVIYRNAPLYPTAEEALIEHWKRHYRP